MRASRDFLTSRHVLVLALRMFIRIPRVLQSLPRVLLSREVILLPPLDSRAAMGMGRIVVQLGGQLMIFVM